MRIELIDEGTARMVGAALRAHGRQARVRGRIIDTDCSAFEIVSLLEREVGLERVEGITLGGAFG
jgi:hypothetical protein